MSDEAGISSQEVSPKIESTLENAYLTHGFKSNTRGIDETNNIIGFISHGSLASFSKQISHGSKDHARGNSITGERIYFSVKSLEESPTSEVSYVGNAVWIAPISSLEGSIVGEGNAPKEIFIHQPGGVEISSERGLTILNEFFLEDDQIWNGLEKYCQTSGVSCSDYIAKNIIFVPSSILSSNEEIQKIAQSRILPANKVSYPLIPDGHILSDTELDTNFTPASAESLGSSGKLDGPSALPETVAIWENQYLNLVSDYSDVDVDDPYNLESFRTSNFFNISKFAHRIALVMPGSELAIKSAEVEAKRQELFTQCEQKLRELHPNPMSYEQFRDLSEPGTYVFLDPDKNIRVGIRKAKRGFGFSE